MKASSKRNLGVGTEPNSHTILIVDDDQLNLKLLKTYLFSAGYGVAEALNGEEALRKAEEKPDLILLDIMMPEVDGFETCRRLKDRESTRDIPVIFLSALQDVQTKVRCLEMGGVDYVSKPFEAREVLARVKTHLTLREQEYRLKNYADKLEQMVENRTTQLIHADRLASVGLLVSGIAHEINNPNNFIAFNMPILRDYLNELIPIIDDYAEEHPNYELFGMSYIEFREDLFKILDNIEQGSKRINLTVSGLKDFARTRDEKKMIWVDLRQIIEKAVAICRSRIKDTIRTFDIHIPENLPNIFTDPEDLEHVVMNLLINAAQAADKPDSWIKLNVMSKNSSTGDLTIEVRDNGCGMDDNLMRKIFDPFFTTKGFNQGIGLGLYSCQNLVKALGGRIEVESESGKGSAFRVILPKAP